MNTSELTEYINNRIEVLKNLADEQPQFLTAVRELEKLRRVVLGR